ncbi:hypothetical protein [Streptomyces aureoverticillatus]|uniref:hypothetical protein n=1 Tax=Streptomyces aureoverticillatus TaxID=66871 RepID=UPI0013DD1F77|nr:hypothetical protein [Streptomyces aureoverticillatus]QIB44429.1 hypothetical protein G3H79_16395 [Streptomyces aureoverticillatus]
MTTAAADRGSGYYTPRSLVIVGAHGLSDDLWDRYNNAVVLDGQHRVSSLWSVLSASIRLHEYLESRPDGAAWALRATIARTAEKDTLLPQATAPSLHGVGEPFRLTYPAVYAEQARRLADSMSALIALIREDLAKALGPCDYEYVDTVPRHDRSPCGVVRLATPTIPRAPGRPNSPSITTRWGVSAARPPGEAHAA